MHGWLTGVVTNNQVWENDGKCMKLSWDIISSWVYESGSAWLGATCPDVWVAAQGTLVGLRDRP